MGKLITLDHLVPDPTWYFPDAYYTWESRRWIYKWPSEVFPHMISIHSDDLEQHKARKGEIRRWIEANADGTVIYKEIDKKYRIYYGEQRDWDHSYEQPNTWCCFYFEDEESALMFKLRFSEYIKELTDLHPTRNDEYEKTSYYQTNRGYSSD